VPDKRLRVRLQLHEAIAEKSARQGLIEFPSEHQHGECFAHAGPDKLFGIRVENDLVELLRIAVKDRRHDAVGGGRDGVAKYCLNFVVRTRIHGADPVDTVPSPKLGQHNREIYGDWLGLSAAEIAALEQDSVI